MEHRTFSIKEALSVGWKKTGEHLRFFMGLYIAIQLVLIVGIMFLERGTFWDKALQACNGFIIGPIITCGLLRIYYEIYTDNASSYKQLFYGIRYFFASMVAAFYGAVIIIGIGIQSVIVTYLTYLVCRAVVTTELLGIGTIIIVSTMFVISFVPLFFFTLTSFEFYPLAIVSDDALSGWQALKLSIKITKGHRIKLLLFMLLSFFLTIFSLGFLWTVVCLAWMHVYFRLKELHG